MIEYSIDCEECDNTSYALTVKKPMHCPICGAEVDLVERKIMDIDSWEIDEDE